MSLGMVLVVLMLVCVLAIPALGGIADARSAPASTPLSPAATSGAMTPPKLDTPRGGIVPAAPAEGSSDPKPKPLPAPAATNHYAGSAENPYV